MRRTDPRLAGLLDLFARLHAADAMPARERIGRWAAQRRLIVVLAALAAGLVGLLLVMGAFAGMQQASMTLIRVRQSVVNGSGTPPGNAPAAPRSATPAFATRVTQAEYRSALSV